MCGAPKQGGGLAGIDLTTQTVIVPTPNARHQALNQSCRSKGPAPAPNAVSHSEARAAKACTPVIHSTTKESPASGGMEPAYRATAASSIALRLP